MAGALGLLLTGADLEQATEQLSESWSPVCEMEPEPLAHSPKGQEKVCHLPAH